MTIARAFVDYLEDLSLGTFGEDIFIGSAPLEGSDRVFWIVSSGGTPLAKNNTGEMQKSYILSVYYRSDDAADVDTKLHDLEESINNDRCTQLSGFDTIDFEATTFASDQDLDSEDRTVGLLQVTVHTYL